MANENALVDYERGFYYHPEDLAKTKIGTEQVGAFRNGGQFDVWANNNDRGIRAGVFNPVEPSYYATAYWPESFKTPNIGYGTLNTPFGSIDYGAGDTDNSFSAQFTPNNYYLKALANMIMGSDKGNF